MAKVNLPLMSGKVRNKVGDIVFFPRGDWGITVARIRVKPANPRTNQQQKVRHNLAILSGIWAGRINAGGQTLYKYNASTGQWTPFVIAATETFGATEKEAWKDYVVISKQGYKLTYKYSFLSTNIKRLYNNQNPLKTPTQEFAEQT